MASNYTNPIGSDIENIGELLLQTYVELVTKGGGTSTTINGLKEVLSNKWVNPKPICIISSKQI